MAKTTETKPKVQLSKEEIAAISELQQGEKMHKKNAPKRHEDSVRNDEEVEQMRQDVTEKQSTETSTSEERRALRKGK